MKNIIKIGLLASLMLVFGGCMDYKADYEDKDLTKFFMKNNKEKLSEIDVIEISRGEWGDTELTTYVFTPFLVFLLYTIFRGYSDKRGKTQTAHLGIYSRYTF